MVLSFCNFVERIVGVENKYNRNQISANIYESLLLEKYSSSCQTPFDEMSVTAHLAIYIYTAIPIFMMALRARSVVSVLTSTMIYIYL
jgi:hypothetical protein